MTPKELRSRRVAAGLSLVELAKATGYTDRQIRRLEKGETPLRPRHATVIEAALLSVKVGHKTTVTPSPKSKIA